MRRSFLPKLPYITYILIDYLLFVQIEMSVFLSSDHSVFISLFSVIENIAKPLSLWVYMIILGSIPIDV